MKDMLLESANLMWDALKPLVEIGALIIGAKLGIKILWAGLKMLAGNIKDKIIKGI